MLQVCSNTEGSFTCDEEEEEAKVKTNLWHIFFFLYEAFGILCFSMSNLWHIFFVLFEAFYISTLQEEACGAGFKFSQYLKPKK